ncbi:MAG TPA: DUF3105 domain-containing protein [Actinomycetota bacterium]|nr:DUF3105 domain-containing protein [Actinomycetota bacterium]
MSRQRPLVAQVVLLAVLALLGWFLLFRQRSPGEIAGDALAAARSAGCDALEQPVVADPDRSHLAPGEAFAYPDPPAAAGPHDPSPLPADPHVHDEPVEESRAVHNLEHAFVLIWYRPSSDGGLPAETTDALQALARNEQLVIMAPYPNLPEGRSLALLAWNTRWMCPADLSPDAATTIAEGFIGAFRGTTVAPEAPRGVLGPLFGG